MPTREDIIKIWKKGSLYCCVYPIQPSKVHMNQLPAMDAPTLHIAMFPWFAIGHLIPYLQLSNKLAKKGHRISFFIPKRTRAKLEHFNLYPDLITFVPITVHHVDGLPRDAETTADLPSSLFPHLMTAMDRTEKQIELLLLELRPKFVFFDFAFWIPNLARRLGIKSFQYRVITLSSAAYVHHKENDIIEFDLMQPSSGFPDLSIKLHSHEARAFAALKKKEFGSGVLFYDRIFTGLRSCDAIMFKGCREIEGSYSHYLESELGKPVLLLGPLLPEQPSSTLEEKWASWLGGFKENSVIYCSFGSECMLHLNQFQELVLGLQLSGIPFLAAVKPPIGFESVEAALPNGFQERVQGREVVYGGWVQQPLILAHPSVGCFITHCGANSLVEALLSKCQLVFLPNLIDQVLNARFIGKSLKAGVEVEKGEEDGLFTKDSVCKAVKLVMDGECEIGREIRTNHAKLRTILLNDNLESTYINSFCHKLQDLLK